LALPPAKLFYPVFASKHKASRKADLSDNTSFRLVNSLTAVSLRFFVDPLQVTEKIPLIQVIMRYGIGYLYSNLSVQLYTTSDHWQPIIINHGDTERIFFARAGLPAREKTPSSVPLW
jgi:hypothetical protein